MEVVLHVNTTTVKRLRKMLGFIVEVSWSGYGACSKSCGPGTKTKTWIADPEPKNGGTPCPSPETVACNLKSCKTCQSNGAYEA